MSGNYYFGDRPDQSGSPVRKILIGISLAVLMCSVVVFGVLYSNSSRLSKVLPAFQKSLESHEYDKALSMYRDIQAKVLNEDPDQTASDSMEKTVMQSMEDSVYARAAALEKSIRMKRYVPGADDRAFLEQMGELTGARLTLWLQSLCNEYLLGTIEKPTLEFIFVQIGTYSNVSAAAEPLKVEIDTIEKYRGDVQTAEQFYSSKSYISAVEKYEEIIASTTGFVNEYAQSRLQECEKIMYD